MVKAIHHFGVWKFRYAIGLLGSFFNSRTRRDPGRILCIISGGLGDKLMSLPAIRCLRAQHPGAHFSVQYIGTAPPLVSREADEIVELSAGSYFARLKHAMQRFDLVFVSSIGVFDVWNELCVLLSRAPQRIGPRFHHVPQMLCVYNRSYVFGVAHETLVNFMAVGGKPSQGERRISYEIAQPRQQRDSGGCMTICFHVGCRKGGECKQWSPAHYNTLMQRLCNDGMEIRLVGDRGESLLMQQAAHGLPNAHIQVCGSADEFVNAVKDCQLIVGNDSGICHLAAACGVPTLTIMAATDPAKCAPFGPKAEVVTTLCDHAFCYWKNGPCSRCIDRIQPLEVENAIRSLLDLPANSWDVKTPQNH